jgi:hypothetical protein
VEEFGGNVYEDLAMAQLMAIRILADALTTTIRDEAAENRLSVRDGQVTATRLFREPSRNV